MTVHEAASIARVSRQAVAGWIKRGSLTLQATADGERIDAAALATFLAARQAATEAGVHVQTLLRWVEELI